MTLSRQWLDDIYKAHKSTINNVFLNSFHSCLIQAYKTANELIGLSEEENTFVFNLPEYCSLKDGWRCSAEERKALAIPEFDLKLSDGSVPKQYFVEKTESKEPNPTSGQVLVKIIHEQNCASVYFRSINDTLYHFSVKPIPDQESDYYRRRVLTQGACLIQNQLKSLLWMKFILHELNQLITNNRFYYGTDVTSYYKSYLFTLLEKIVFSNKSYVNPVFFDLLVQSLFPPFSDRALSPRLNLIQSQALILIAGHNATTMDFFKYLSRDPKLYSGSYTQMPWTELFIVLMYVHEVEHSGKALDFILSKLFSSEPTDLKEDTDNKKALLNNVIAGLRIQLNLNEDARYGCLTDKAKGPFLKKAFNQLLLMANAPALNKAEKYAVRDYAIEKIIAIQDSKEKTDYDPIKELDQLYDQYTSSRLITGRRHVYIDKAIEVFRFFFTPYKSKFYGDTEIDIRQTLNLKLEEFKGLPNYKETFDKFNEKKHLDRMATVLPVTVSLLRRNRK